MIQEKTEYRNVEIANRFYTVMICKLLINTKHPEIVDYMRKVTFRY